MVIARAMRPPSAMCDDNRARSREARRPACNFFFFQGWPQKAEEGGKEVGSGSVVAVVVRSVVTATSFFYLFRFKLGKSFRRPRPVRPNCLTAQVPFSATAPRSCEPKEKFETTSALWSRQSSGAFCAPQAEQSYDKLRKSL